jgi:hypothetical protein
VARIGIAITKVMPFRNSTQDFSNVYYYENAGSHPNQAGAEALIDELVAIEKTFHATNATFKIGRCWSQIGTPSQNNMIAQKALSGTGARASEATMDRERAYLFRRRAGVDSRGRPVYFRKYYHCTASFPGGPTLAGGVLSQTSGYSTAERAAMAINMDEISTLTAAGGNWSLVSKSGRQATEAGWDAHQFLEHHQLGDMWRGQ